MSTVHVQAERVLDAPADVVYRCIADYRQHHRPGGFLPPAFTDLQVERGGVGAGTVIRVTSVLAGRRQTIVQEISEPEPGRVLVEHGSGITTIFSVDAVGHQSRVRFDTSIEAHGAGGLLNRLVVPRLLRPLYADELGRLEKYAQARAAIAAERAGGQ